MLKKLWERLHAIVAGTDTMDEETFGAQHKLLADLDTRLKGVEDYLSMTPNHIGQRYIPATIEIADGIANADVPEAMKSAIDSSVEHVATLLE